MTPTGKPKLSICIATFNRGAFISETLDSILGQIESGIEIVVVDGASPDNTMEVMTAYVQRHQEVKYFREAENSGVDADFDKAVGYARGEYCWLMTDDDLLKPGALAQCDVRAGWRRGAGHSQLRGQERGSARSVREAAARIQYRQGIS